MNFLVGNVKGCFVPLAAILNDGTDYVLTVSGDRAVRKNVTIEGIYNFEAMVTGLSDGELLIVSGINRLSTGDRVTVKEVDYGTDN